MKKSILINVQEGVSPESLLPANPLEMTERFIIEAVHSPNVPVENGEAFLLSNKKSVVEGLSETEKKVYRTYKIEVPDSVDAEQLLKDLYNKAGVNYVQMNQINDLYKVPDDVLIPQMYALKKIQAFDAWNYSSGKSVVVAVVDTGVDYKHPDISKNMWDDGRGRHGFNFSENNFDPMDYHSHGTHVAGTIAATGNNSIGITGVAFDARIMALKVFPNAYDDVCAKAIKFAADNGARIINNSWGPTVRRPSNPVVEEAIDYAVLKGAMVIFAAGNFGDDVAFYSPANYPQVFCVAATDVNDQVADFSNHGGNVAIAAPGKGILSLKFASTDYSLKSGTSMAAPHVAGVAALMVAQKPGITVAQLRKKLMDTADNISTAIGKPVGAGRLNAFKAIR